MTIKEFLDTKLEKGTHDIEVIDTYGYKLHGVDYDNSDVLSVVYRKSVVITMKKSKYINLLFSYINLKLRVITL